MGDATPTSFALDSFVVNRVHVDPSALRLSSPQGESRLEPKVMALLIVLAKKPGELRRRAELVDELWPNGFGGDESLSRLISLLRKTFSADHGLDDIVTTVPKLGYRLDATVDFSALKPELESASSEPSRENSFQTAGSDRNSARSRLYALAAVALVAVVIGLAFFFADRSPSADAASQIGPDRSDISIAVLPIESMDEMKDRSFLADGMTRDLTASLSQVPNARVAPYSSTRLLAGSRVDGAATAKNLGVRYIITGAMAVQGEQLVLRMDLTDAVEKRQIWSKRFTEPLDNFFALQDQVVREISTSIFSEIQASEIASVRSRDEFDLSIYELIQRAEAERYSYGRESAARITSYLERAVEIDPDSYSARAALAIQLAQNVISGFSDNPARDIPLSLQYLDEMRAIAPRDPGVLMSTAMVEYYVNGDMRQGQRLLERSLEIDPNEPHAAVILGLMKCYTGQPDEGLTLIRKSEARAPRDPRYGIWAWFRAACYSVEGKIVQAKSSAAQAIDRNPNYPPFHYALASYECLLGNESAARKAVQQSRRLDMKFDQKDYERLLSTAGFPGTPGQSRDELFRIMRACLGSATG